MAAEEQKDEAAEKEESKDVAVVEGEEKTEPRNWMTDLFDEWPRMIGRRFPEPIWRMAGMEPMRVEQYTDDDDVVIRAEVPGVDPEENIDVSVVGDKLTISAKREQREESKTDEGFHSEFHYGSFRRVMTLPAGTAAEDVQASYEDGILEVRVPTDTTKATTTKVAVKRGS